MKLCIVTITLLSCSIGFEIVKACTQAQKVNIHSNNKENSDNYRETKIIDETNVFHKDNRVNSVLVLAPSNSSSASGSNAVNSVVEAKPPTAPKSGNKDRSMHHGVKRSLAVNTDNNVPAAENPLAAAVNPSSRSMGGQQAQLQQQQQVHSYYRQDNGGAGGGSPYGSLSVQSQQQQQQQQQQHHHRRRRASDKQNAKSVKATELKEGISLARFEIFSYKNQFYAPTFGINKVTSDTFAKLADETVNNTYIVTKWPILNVEHGAKPMFIRDANGYIMNQDQLTVGEGCRGLKGGPHFYYNLDGSKMYASVSDSVSFDYTKDDLSKNRAFATANDPQRPYDACHIVNGSLEPLEDEFYQERQCAPLMSWLSPSTKADVCPAKAQTESAVQPINNM